MHHKMTYILTFIHLDNLHEHTKELELPTTTSAMPISNLKKKSAFLISIKNRGKGSVFLLPLPRSSVQFFSVDVSPVRNFFQTAKI